MAIVIGQLLFKIGAEGKTFESVASIMRILVSPIILSGLVIYAGATILWLYVLSKLPLSQAYPIQALALPSIIILANLLLGETIPTLRWIGVALIFIGIIFVTR